MDDKKNISLEELEKMIYENNNKIIINNIYIDKIIELTYKNETKKKYLCTSFDNPITIWQYNCYINNEFYQKNQDRIDKLLKNFFLIDKQNISYPGTHQALTKKITNKTINFKIDKEIIEYILNNPKYTYFIYSDLSEENIEIFKKNHIECYYHNQKISTNIAIDNYYFDELPNENLIFLSPKEYSNEEINSLTLLKDNTVIKIPSWNIKNEKDYYEQVNKLAEQLNKLNKPLILSFKIHDYQLFTTNNFIKKYDNITYNLEYDLSDFTYEEFFEMDEKLNKLVENIKKANLSPLERHIAVFNIVKNYKTYKESNNKEESRYLKYILDNEYLVCVGFSKLLVLLDQKVGINCNELSLSVDVSYDHGFTKEEKPVEYGGHARNMINIDDSKYNVHGLFISDATWDNNLDKDYLNHSLFPIDKTDIAKRMVKSNDIDLILNIHSFSEYCEKVNYLLKKEQDSYRFFYDYIKNLFTDLNDSTINKLLDECNIDDEKSCNNFITNVGHYLLTRTNQQITSKQIVSAHLAGKRKLLNLTKKQIKNLKQQLLHKYARREKALYPYHINEKNQVERNNTRNK